jgi:hypothetical protein
MRSARATHHFETLGAARALFIADGSLDVYIQAASPGAYKLPPVKRVQ